MSSIDNQLSSCTEENVILVNQSSIVKIESNPLEDRISIMKSKEINLHTFLRINNGGNNHMVTLKLTTCITTTNVVLNKATS